MYLPEDKGFLPPDVYCTLAGNDDMEQHPFIPALVILVHVWRKSQRTTWSLDVLAGCMMRDIRGITLKLHVGPLWTAFFATHFQGQ